jgi:tetratricopeptide (TPR) repeat protein
MSAAPVLTKVKSFSLQVVAGPGLQGEKFYFNKPKVTVGRDPGNDIILEKDAKVSRQHIEITQNLGVISVINISGKNSLLVNGKKVESFALTESTNVQIGDTVLKFEFSGELIKAVAQQVPALKVAPKANVPSPKINQNRPQPTFQQIPPNPPSPPQAKRNVSLMDNGPSKNIIYGLVVVIVLGMAWKFNSSSSSSDGQTPTENSLNIRSSEDIALDVEKAEKAISDFNASVEKKGENSLQFQTAQQHYIKGFRDYRQGQYDRAIQSLQAALSFYPQHVLAMKYIQQSRKKQDELIKFQMSQGLRYQGKGNWRLCSASYRQAMTMLKDEKNPNYMEAKKFLEQCELMQKGKY